MLSSHELNFFLIILLFNQPIIVHLVSFSEKKRNDN